MDEKLYPGKQGTCWCCGAEKIQDITELCIECEQVRAEVWYAVADKNQKKAVAA